MVVNIYTTKCNISQK